MHAAQIRPICGVMLFPPLFLVPLVLEKATRIKCMAILIVLFWQRLCYYLHIVQLPIEIDMKLSSVVGLGLVTVRPVVATIPDSFNLIILKLSWSSLNRVILLMKILTYS